MFTAEELDGTICAAREYVQHIEDAPEEEFEALADDFAQALVQIADQCVVGLPCDQHGGAVHGREAEELRKGIENIIAQTVGDDACPDSARDVLHALQRLLDDVDARDSLVFLEAPAHAEGGS